jgi:hypothetical protein
MVDEIVEKCNDPSFFNTSWAFGPPVQEPVPLVISADSRLFAVDDRLSFIDSLRNCL